MELEVQLSFANEKISVLDEGLRQQSARVFELEEEVRLLKEAFKRAQQPQSSEPVLQGHEDPVPSSG